MRRPSPARNPPAKLDDGSPFVNELVDPDEYPLYDAVKVIPVSTTNDDGTETIPSGFTMSYLSNFSNTAQPTSDKGLPDTRDFPTLASIDCTYFFGNYTISYLWRNGAFNLSYYVKLGDPLGNTEWQTYMSYASLDPRPRDWPADVVTQDEKDNFFANHMLIVDIIETLFVGRINMDSELNANPDNRISYTQTQVAFSRLFNLEQEDAPPEQIRFSAHENMPKAIYDTVCTMMYALASAGLNNATVPGTHIPDVRVWSYSTKQLWTVYSAAILLTLVVAITGHVAMHRNGFGGDNTFSHFLAITRHRELDALIGNGKAEVVLRADSSGQYKFRLA